MADITDVDGLLDAFGGDVEEKYPFYKGEVMLGYDSKKHVYFRYEDGIKILVPGVTSVVGIIDKSGPLTQWAANETCNYVRTKLVTDGKVFPFLDPITGDLHEYIDTEILLAWLEEARFNYRTISKTATDIGHIAHDWLEKYNIARLNKDSVAEDDLLAHLPEDEKAKNCVEAALDWMIRHNYEPIYTERKIYSRIHDYAGTLDNVGWFDGCGDESCCGKYAYVKHVLVVTDWKSSKSHYDEYRFQTAAYLEAIHEETGKRPELRIVIRLGKEDGVVDPKIYGADSQAEDFGAFFHALELYNRVKYLENAEREKKAKAKEAGKAEKAALKETAKLEKAAAKLAAKKTEAKSRVPVEA
jgi:hypothetical protein